MMRKFAALAFAIGGIVSTTGHAENLLDVYRAALKSDPQYLASGARQHQSEKLREQQESVLYPQATLALAAKRSLDPQSTPEQSANQQSLILQITQQIYHQDTWIGLNQADKRIKQAELANAAELQNLILRVASAYFNVLAAADGVEFANAELKSVGQQLEQTQQRFAVGLIAITDVHEAQARYDAASASMILAQNTLDNANESLRQVSGNYYSHLGTLRADLPMQAPEPANAEDWVHMAENNNVTLQSQRLSVEIARSEIKRQGSAHMPYVDATLQGEKARNDPATIFAPASSTLYSAGIQLTIPLFSGFRTSAAVDQAEYAFVESSQNMEAQHRVVVRDTHSAYLGVNASISAVKAYTQAVVSAQSALEATQAGFEVGTRTIVDVLLATSNLYNAKKNLSVARYNYVIGLLQLKGATSSLDEKDVADLSSWLQ